MLSRQLQALWLRRAQALDARQLQQRKIDHPEFRYRTEEEGPPLAALLPMPSNGPTLDPEFAKTVLR